MNTLIKDERIVTSEELVKLPHSKILDFEEIASLLASPDTGNDLVYDQQNGFLTDSEHQYPVIDGIPILYPAIILNEFLNGSLELAYHTNPKLQYFLLSQIKQHGDTNAPATNVHYQRHLYRMKEFLKNCAGTVLDIGCDDVSVSSSLFNDKCTYIGLDPFTTHKSKFRVVGVGEFLPFRDQVIDNVLFNTSLDHILDYHQAINEAKRVIKTGGSIYLTSLVWTHNASLIHDSVHFHHFREYEIFGALGNMKIANVLRYRYKDDEHRYGIFIEAIKQAD